MSAVLLALHARAQSLLPRAYAPYSHRPQACALLTADGIIVPGVRVENGSYGLTCDALLGVRSAHASTGSAAPIALAFAHPHTATDRLHARAWTGVAEEHDEHVLVLSNDPIPPLDDWWTPQSTPPTDGDASPSALCDHAMTLASQRAVVSESDFPVGCWGESVALDGTVRWIPGVNVESSDWSRVLCAERAVIHLAHALGLPIPRRFFLACVRVDGSPCGACRQWLTEHAASAEIWMHRRNGTPTLTHPPALLPGAFDAVSLRI